MLATTSFALAQNLQCARRAPPGSESERTARALVGDGPLRDPALAVFHLAFFALRDDAPAGELSREARLERHAGSPVLFAASLKHGPSDLAREALALEAGFVEAHLVLGRAQAEAQRFGDARRHYEEVAHALPESAAAHMALGDVFFVMGDLPRALATYDRVIARRASHHALLRKGIILSVMDRPDEALPVLARVIESHWLPGEAHYWTARNQLRLGALAKAAASADVAKRSLAGDPATRLVAGQVAVAQGRWDAAEPDVTAAVSITKAKKELAGRAAVRRALFARSPRRASRKLAVRPGSFRGLPGLLPGCQGRPGPSRRAHSRLGAGPSGRAPAAAEQRSRKGAGGGRSRSRRLPRCAVRAACWPAGGSGGAGARGHQVRRLSGQSGGRVAELARE